MPVSGTYPAESRVSAPTRPASTRLLGGVGKAKCPAFNRVRLGHLQKLSGFYPHNGALARYGKCPDEETTNQRQIARDYHWHMPDPLSPVLPAAPSEASPPASELRKPHEMIVMLPRSKRVTLTGRLLYNAMLHVSQNRLQSLEVMPSADFMFEAPLPALLRTTGSSGEDRTAAKRYLREMRSLEVDWESTAPGDGVKWRGFSMLAEVAIELRGGENWVSWAFPPTIMTALRDPTRWARIDLDVLAGLSTYASVALYEICARYRDNPGGVTSRKPTQWWIDALGHGPAGTDRREWRKVKSEKVKPAIEEISRQTDLEIELIEHKTGRMVTEVQFSVRRKRELRSRMRVAGPVDASLVLRAESLGIREIKLDALVTEFGADLVREKLALLEQRAARNERDAINNAYAYLRASLRNEGLAAPDPAPPPAPREDGPAAAAPQAGDAGWLTDRIAALKREIAGLAAEQKTALADAAVADLARRGMLSAVVKRRAAQGDILHDLLGSVVVRIFAEGKYGPGWNLPPPAPEAVTSPAVG